MLFRSDRREHGAAEQAGEFHPARDRSDERGTGAGVGLNVNLPMPHRSPESVFFDKLGEALAAVERFQPDALVLSLGFDIYREDPQSQVDVSTEGFGRLGTAVGALGLPTLVVQEGGYHLETLGDLVASTLRGLAED